MKRVNMKLASVICMAVAVFSMTTCDVKASTGYFDPSTKTQEQTGTTTKKTTSLDTEETSSIGGSYLTAEQQSIIDNLGTDYSKVNWDMQYSIKGKDGIIISVADYMDGRYPYLLVAVTNIYDKDVTFSASGYAEGLRGEEVADISFYEDAIRPGSTIAKAIYCDGTPSCDIFWEYVDFPNVYSESVSWGGDWHLTTDTDGYYKIDYNIDSNNYMMPGYVTALLLNKNGDIVDAAYDYSADKGYYVSGTIQFFEKGYDEKVVDVAIFSNPLKTK